MKLSVYAGESGFSRRLIHDRTLPVHRLTPPRWSLDVARDEDGKPALFILSRAAGTLFGRPEVHVVPGLGFHAVTVNATLSSELAGARRFLIGSSRAGPAVYSFRRLRPRLVELRATPLGVPLSSPRC